MPNPALHQTSASELEISSAENPGEQDLEDDLFEGRYRTERDNLSGSVSYNCFQKQRKPRNLPVNCGGIWNEKF